MDAPHHPDDIKIIGPREAVWLQRLFNPTLCFIALGTRDLAEDWCTKVKENWRDTTDPYPSVSQIRSLLLLHFGQSIRVVAAVTVLCDHYVRVKPYCRDGRTPRSLLHLSRCAIRKALDVNKLLPIGIQLLEVPTELVRYLQLKI